MEFGHKTIFGFRFAMAGSEAEVAQAILEDAASGKVSGPQFLVTPNAYNTLHYFDKGLEAIYAQHRHARYILADGTPIVWLSRLLPGPSLPARITGSDLFPQLWKRIKEQGYHATMVLASEELAQGFKKDYPLSHCLVPRMFRRDEAGYIREFATAVADTVIATGSPFLFTGINFPKQELIGTEVAGILRSKGYEKPVLILFLGASFEFYLGIKKRAPVFFQKTGLEWLHRLLSEPGRLWKRYTVDLFRFALLSLKEIFNN